MKVDAVRSFTKTSGCVATSSVWCTWLGLDFLDFDWVFLVDARWGRGKGASAIGKGGSRRRPAGPGDATGTSQGRVRAFGRLLAGGPSVWLWTRISVQVFFFFSFAEVLGILLLHCWSPSKAQRPSTGLNPIQTLHHFSLLSKKWPLREKTFFSLYLYLNHETVPE